MLDKVKKHITPDNVLGALFCIMMGGFFLLETSPHRLVLYGVLIVGLYCMKKGNTWSIFKNKDIIWRLTLLFLGFALLSVLWSNGMDAERILQKIKPALFITLTSAIFVHALIKHPNGWKTLLEVFVLAALISALILLILRREDIWNAYMQDSNRIWRLKGIGRGQNENIAGLLYGIAALLSLFLNGTTIKAFRYKAVRGVSFLFLFTILLLTLSRGALLGFIGASFVLSIVFIATPDRLKRYNKIILAVSVLLCLEALFLLSNYPDILTYMIERGTTGRFQIWEIAWAHILEKPLFGHGIGTKFIYEVYDKMDIKVGHAHNLYLSIILQVGVLGFALFLSLAALALLRAFKYAQAEDDYAPLIMLSYGLSLGLVDFGGYYTSLGVTWLVFWVPVSYLVFRPLHDEAKELS